MKLEIDNFDIDHHFITPVFRFHKPEFLNSVKPVFNEYVDRIKKNKNKNDPHPGVMTELMSADERIETFCRYISDITWDVLNKQGYNMDLFYTDASEIWGQHHPFMSSMDKHTHGQGTYLTGFYFLDTPDNSSKMFIHDPSLLKTHINLPVRHDTELSFAQTSVFYDPKPGDLIFTNSWVEHSFTRNASQMPYNFIHINVKVVLREQSTPIVI